MKFKEFISLSEFDDKESDDEEFEDEEKYTPQARSIGIHRAQLAAILKETSLLRLQESIELCKILGDVPYFFRTNKIVEKLRRNRNHAAEMIQRWIDVDFHYPSACFEFLVGEDRYENTEFFTKVKRSNVKLNRKSLKALYLDSSQK